MRVGPATNVARINVSETITALWTFAHANGISLDDVIERTGGAGVTIDGVLLKNGVVDLRDRIAAATVVLQSDVVGDSITRLIVRADGLLQWGDGTLARDTDLFRALADVLATSDSFRVGGVLGVITDIITERTADTGVTIDGLLVRDKSITALAMALATNRIMESNVAGDTERRFRLEADGTHRWGPGDAVADTTLYRDAPNVLKTDDSLEVAGVLGVVVDDITERTPTLGVMIDGTLLKDGGIELTADIVLPDRTIALAIGANANVATGTVPVQRLSVAGGAADISGFAGGVAGRLLIVYNIVTLDITLQHQNGGSVAANRIMCPGNVNLLLDPSDSAMLRYDDTLSRWFVISAGV
ncbi:hypothetical protein LCGC14_0912060 [marine sediment metagenome]|uniref:Uncharacterized protein n=1 Tax=marine sediment metagenome TaxID=412755 RepID=A0A0F9NT84_9ZZZZ